MEKFLGWIYVSVRIMASNTEVVCLNPPSSCLKFGMIKGKGKDEEGG